MKLKFALAFSNQMSPEGHTHSECEYITGRWTDSFASGGLSLPAPSHAANRYSPCRGQKHSSI
jgi:hypothetical protein